MNPNKINAILSGKSKLNISEIFNTAFANQLLKNCAGPKNVKVC